MNLATVEFFFANSTMTISNMQCMFLSTNLHSNASVHCLRICYANVLPYLIHQWIEVPYLFWLTIKNDI